jgi:hypothetical protein
MLQGGSMYEAGVALYCALHSTHLQHQVLVADTELRFVRQSVALFCSLHTAARHALMPVHISCWSTCHCHDSYCYEVSCWMLAVQYCCSFTHACSAGLGV